MAVASEHALSPRARLEIAAARLIGTLPPAAKRRIAGEPIRRDGLELDLDMHVLLKLAAGVAHDLAAGTPAQARTELREGVRPFEGRRIEMASVRETTIDGAAGALPARLFVPEPQGPSANGTPGALIVYFHGGGWVTGDLDTHDQPCRLLARSSGARVLSVAYRLAPEHPFPAAVEDALAAFRAAVVKAEELGADPARVAVAGDSAGGHLAAVTARLSAADGGPTPAFQLLIYPVTDLVNTAPSRLTFADGFILTKANMDWYEEQFLGPAGDRSDPRVSPLLAEELAGTPPALVVTAGFDPLRDEGEAYARRLAESGVRTLVRRYSGYVHGFIHALALGSGPREAVAEMGGVLRAAL
ncbi:MAG TPA: alpha/beta hydrolase [Solirubrobacteraceae bacterium]|nr:alpha/beta hydrolase [Solirubrobacteraceae bacterium]